MLRAMAFPGARRTLLATLVVIAIAATAAAQIWVGGYGRRPPRFPTETSFTGGFNFCRVMFTSTHREKQGWGTDYPGADINFSIRVAELTKIQVKMTDADGEESDPDAVVVRLTDEALFNCPFIFMEDAGTARFSPTEVARPAGLPAEGRLSAGRRLSRHVWAGAIR